MHGLPRSSGILLHPTSLPGPFGIGDLGPAAYRFVDFLVEAGQRLWQMLPLVPVGLGFSPYASPSTFAGNPLLISPERLVEQGLLQPDDIARPPDFPEDRVDYDWVIVYKQHLLEKAYATFEAHPERVDETDFWLFCEKQAYWLDDYALFMALKEAHGGALWTEWPIELVRRDPPRCIAPARSWPVRSASTSSGSTSFTNSGWTCGLTATSGASGSWATSRSTSRTTAPTSGPIRTCSIWTSAAIPR